jgi:hypothetical protein
MTESQKNAYKAIESSIDGYGHSGLFTLVVHKDNYEDAKIAAREYNHEMKRQGIKTRVTVKAVNP